MKTTDRYAIEGVTCTLDSEVMKVYNLSVGGLFAGTERPPLRGQVVELVLNLPGRAAFAVMAHVTWTNDPQAPRATDLPQGFGVKITRIALPDRVAVLDLLRRRGPGHGSERAEQARRPR